MGSPEVARRRIGAELKQLRDRAGLTQSTAAAVIGTNQGNVSSMEAGRRVPTIPQLKLLLDAYGAREEVRDELLNLAGASRYPNWWAHQYGGTAVPEYARSLTNLERGAAEKWEYHSETMPGLMQIEPVIRTLFATTTDLADLVEPADFQHRVRVRVARQDVLTRREPAPLVAHTVLNEAVLRRPVGGPDIMRAQLLHLLKLAGLPNVNLQVLPFAVGAHPAYGASFQLLRMPDQVRPELVYQEGLTTAAYLDRPEDVRGHMLTWDRVSEVALDPVESLHLISSVADGYL